MAAPGGAGASSGPHSASPRGSSSGAAVGAPRLRGPFLAPLGQSWSLRARRCPPGRRGVRGARPVPAAAARERRCGACGARPGTPCELRASPATRAPARRCHSPARGIPPASAETARGRDCSCRL